MAVAEVSDDRVLVASPSAEVELGLSISDARLESIARAVFAKLWSIILTVKDSWKNVPVFWYAAIDKLLNQKMTLAGQQ